MSIQTALVSVFEKEGIVEFCSELHKLGIKIISSGGTSNLLKKNKIKVTDVSSLTGFPEMMDGRVKTLHPKIHGGILADRTKKKHLEEAKKQEIELIDLVVVNLYPFEKTVSKENVSLEEAIENIDIGGPTLIRAAAKNFQSVAVVCNPSKYGAIIKELKEKKEISLETKKALALEAFEHVAHYDAVIENYLRKTFNGAKYHDPTKKVGSSYTEPARGSVYPEYLNLTFKKIQDLRYGENPHQTAAYYRDEQINQPCIPLARQLQGRELSYNNILDLHSALTLLKSFKDPTTVIVKHNNPCGVASDFDLLESYKKALRVDQEAAFGGVIAVNREIEKNLAEAIVTRFYEVVLAPKISPEAVEIFKAKKNLRLMEMGEIKMPFEYPKFKMYRSIAGGLLVQDADNVLYDESKFKIVTKRAPTQQEMKDLLYAWTICKYVKSNSIIYARDNRVIGIGAGQMKRVDAAKLAAMIVESYGEKIEGCSMASDAFFPFRDAVDEASKRGVKAIIQPGGSIKDQEVINAADEKGIAMVFTGMRHFRH